MTKSGLKHIDVGSELTKTEWESEESHEVVHGTSFPSSPVERQLFYRDDKHKWYIYDGTAWRAFVSDVDLSAHAADLSAHIRDLREIWRTGTYMPSLLFTNDWIASAAALTANRLEAIGYPIPRTMIFDRIGFYVSTGGAPGTQARLGIYQDDGNCYPGTLVLDAGLVAVDSTGIKEITINQQLSKGLYWLVIISDGTPAVWGRSDEYLGLFGSPTVLYQFYAAWYKDDTFGPLPSQFPSGATAQIRLFGIALRVSSLG
jgi:hypothetical protein